MAGDDTTPDSLFKNVPRRPRSAASAYASWPRKEEPDGGSDPGASVSDNATTSSGSSAGHAPRAKKRRVAPIEEPEPADAKDRGGGALDRLHGIVGGMPPALSKNKDKAAASASSSDPEEPAVDWWSGNERRRKGKTAVVNEDDARAVFARRSPVSGHHGGKLLGDAIRAHGSTTGIKPSSRTKPKKAAKKKDRAKPKKKKAMMMKDSSAWFWCVKCLREGMSSAGSDADYSFDRIGIVSDRLRTTLGGLGVAPVRVYGRLLTMCDRDALQTRLLMSCKRWRAADVEFPLQAFLTEQEREHVHGDGGLSLMAYDRGGEPFEIKLKFLESNVGYRLINKWGDFLRHNGLVVLKDEPEPVDDDVMLDLWLFRPPAGGELGMVMLHYRRGDAAHADAVLDEVEQKRRQQELLNIGDAGTGGNGNDDGGGGDAVMEDFVGDANEYAGVKGEVAAAAPAPSSSPSSEPSGGGAIKAAEDQASGSGKVPDAPSEPDGGTKQVAEEQPAAPGEVADAPSLTSSELQGGAGRRSDELTAPLSLGGDGTKEEQEAGGALMVMVLEVEAATQSSSDSNGGGAANEVAAPPPPSSPEAGGGAAMMATENEAAAELAEVEAVARSWNFTKYEVQAAQAMVMLSKTNSKAE